MKATKLLKEDIMFAAILNDVQKNGAIHATSVPNAIWDCALPTVLKIFILYRRSNIISYKTVKLNQK
jgi:hypothetical protein